MFKRGKKTESKSTETKATEVEATPISKPVNIVKTPRVVENLSTETETGADKFVKSFKGTVSEVDGESIADRCKRFNKYGMSTNFKSVHEAVSKAIDMFGEQNFKQMEGLNKHEIAFEVDGVRLPEKGYYMIRS